MTSPRFSAGEVSAALSGAQDLEFLGSGSFGDTWRVGSRALKIICVDGYPADRLAREVAGLERVKSPHVVALLDKLTVHLGGRPRPALVFEFIDGGDVQKRIDSADWPSIAQGEALLRGLLEGVQDLHSSDGTIHRDLKPANVALRAGDWADPVILDLGLAKAMNESTFTVYPGHVGTAPYMAPEQLKAQRARKAADLFAIGVVVRQVLGHRHPFYDDGVTYTIDEAIRRIEAGPAPLPTSVPTAVAELLDRLVAPAEHERGSAGSALRRLGGTK